MSDFQNKIVVLQDGKLTKIGPADNLEIGGKFTLLDGAAQLNVAIFRTEFDELQVSTITAQGAATVINAAGATTQGLELDGSWRASDSPTAVARCLACISR